LQSSENGLNKGIELLDRAVVDIGVRRPTYLLVVRKQSRRPLGDRFAPSRRPQLLWCGDDDDRVEQRICPRFVEQRDLDDGDGGVDAYEPVRIALADVRVKQLFEPLELAGVCEDAFRDLRAIEGAEALLESSSDIGILRVEVVDDLV
jgi:hypothetical protein